MIQSNDSGFVLAGTESTFGAGIHDMYLVKTDRSGNLLWTKTYGGLGSSVGNSIATNSSGDYLIAGYTTGFGTGNEDIYLVNTDSSGTLRWSKCIGGTDYERARTCVAISDGSYAVAGYTRSVATGFQDAYLCKINNSGNVIWNKTYSSGANYFDIFNSIHQTNDGGFVLIGSSTSCGGCSPDVMLIKTDSGGTPQWARTYDGGVYDIGTFIKQTNDNGYIITGITNGPNYPATDVCVIKTDSTGDVEWAKSYGDTMSDEGYWIEQTMDGGFIITGRTQVSGGGSWSGAFGSSNIDYGYSVKQTADNGYMVAGVCQFTDYDMYLVKTDSSGHSGCNERTVNTLTTVFQTSAIPFVPIISSGLTDTPAGTVPSNGGIQITYCNSTGENEITIAEEYISISPNPAKGIINIESKFILNGTLSIYNSAGKNIYETVLINQGSTQVHTQNFNSGIYFVVVAAENVRSCRKVVIGLD